MRFQVSGLDTPYFQWLLSGRERREIARCGNILMVEHSLVRELDDDTIYVDRSVRGKHSPARKEI